MLFDASPDGGIDRFIFCGGLLPPVFSVLLQPVTAMLVAFRVAFPPQGGSPLCIELVQQPLDALKAFVAFDCDMQRLLQDRKSTRLNSSHPSISYAVFCLKKKKHHPSRRHLR